MIERILLLIFSGVIFLCFGKDGVFGAMSALVLFQFCHRIRYGMWFE